MHRRNLRHLLLAGATRLILSAADGDDEPAGGAGGAPPAAAPAGEGDPPAPAAAAPAGEETGAAPAGDDAPAGAAAADAGAEEGAQQKPTRIPWQTKRIDALTAQAKQEKEAREAAEAAQAATAARLQAYEALYGTDGDAPPAGGSPPPPPAAGKVFTEADVQAEAARIAGLQRLNDRCETLFKDGAAKHGAQWNTRVAAVGQAFGGDLQRRPDFFEALTSLPNGADVYNLLAADLDHFGEVLTMDGVKLGMELALLSTKAAAKPKGPAVSEAPAPIEPVEGTGGGDDDLTKLSMDDFAKTREKQREERYKAKGYA
jgi:hypothetical protein